MSASSDVDRPDRLGRASLVLGIVAAALQAGEAVATQLAPRIQVDLQLSADRLDAAVLLPFQVAIGVVAVLALGTGVVALMRRGRRAAAAGAALGASALLVLGTGLVAAALYRAAL